MHPSGTSMKLATVAVALALQSCASPQVAVTQTIHVQTPGCERASCDLSNDRGTWHVAQTPGSVVVSISSQPLKVICRGNASSATKGSLSSARPQTSGGGAVTGGVVGGAMVGVSLGAAGLAFIPPLGAIAVLGGAALGAMAGEAAESQRHSVRYPDLASIPMRCGASDGDAGAAAAPAPEFGLTVRGMTLAESSAAGVEARTAVLVVAVDPQGLAALGGLRSGDVILTAEGRDLLDAADLQERVDALQTGAALALRILRDHAMLSVTLTRPTRAVP